MSGNNAEFIELTASIVSAFIANNSVPASDLPGLIASPTLQFSAWTAMSPQSLSRRSSCRLCR
jgi:predicted transcriptional regulator